MRQHSRQYRDPSTQPQSLYFLSRSFISPCSLKKKGKYVLSAAACHPLEGIRDQGRQHPDAASKQGCTSHEAPPLLAAASRLCHPGQNCSNGGKGWRCGGQSTSDTCLACACMFLGISNSCLLVGHAATALSESSQLTKKGVNRLTALAKGILMQLLLKRKLFVAAEMSLTHVSDVNGRTLQLPILHE